MFEPAPVIVDGVLDKFADPRAADAALTNYDNMTRNCNRIRQELRPGVRPIILASRLHSRRIRQTLYQSYWSCTKRRNAVRRRHLDDQHIVARVSMECIRQERP